MIIVMCLRCQPWNLATSENCQLRACRLKQDGPYDSQLLPFLLTTVLMVSLLITFGGSVAKLSGWQGGI